MKKATKEDASAALFAFLFELWQRKWLFVAIALGLIVSILPTAEGLTRDGLIILGISVGAMVIFITEPIPLPTVALLIAILQVVFLHTRPKVVAQSYMSDSVFFIMGSLMLAVAFVKQKLDRRMAIFLLKITKGNTSAFAASILITSALLASLIGEHTVAAILLPVCLVVIKIVQDRRGLDTGLVGLLLFSLAYGCTIAGVGTPSGGARNAIMIQYFHDLAGIEVGYIEWIASAYPVLILMLPVFWFIIQHFCKPKNKNLTDVMEKIDQEVKESGSMGIKDWMTLGIFFITLILWVTASSYLGLGIIALIGASLYLITGCVEWRDLNSGVNWGAVLLYAAAMSMGVAMVKTKAAAWVAVNFLSLLQTVGLGNGIGLIIAVTILVTVVTNSMSSGAAVAVMAPITLQIAEIAGMNIVLMGFVTVIASALGFISVGSHPGMTIVYSSGQMPVKEYIKMGWKVTLASVIILIIFASTYLTWVTG